MGKNLIQKGNQSAFRRGEYNAFGDLTFYVPWGVLVLGAAGLVWQVYRRRLVGWTTALWLGGVLVLSNPYLVRLPGTGIVNNFTVLIMLYLPVSVLAGVLFGEVMGRLWHSWRWAGPVLTSAIILALAVWGVRQRTRDLHLAHALVSEADMRAMAWIRENTPPDARFLVNGFAAYGGNSVVGADAGWWIPLLAARENTIPPLTYGVEETYDPDYRIQLRKDYAHLTQVSLTSPEGVAYLQEMDITHLYVGQRKGRVGNPGEPLLNAEDLASSPQFKLVYDQDAIWIWELGVE
jgi:hypothetical protein